MAKQQESVVTPERFAQGQSYADWFQAIDRNEARFQENYDGTRVFEDDARALRELVARPNGPARCLALGEPWCPDVFRGLPVMVRIAEAAGMELRIFPRDDNLDIMNEFLNRGESQSIPTLVFYTRDHRYIAHWIERPAKANAQLVEIPKLFEGLDREKDREEMRERYDEFQRGPIWASWRQATVQELRELLQEKCG